MKNIFLLLLLFTGIVKGQIVNIPDANFKNALVNTNCIDFESDNVGDTDADSNNDGEIDFSEAASVNNLIIPNSNISDLTGIEAFLNIERLLCYQNQLTSIDVSSLSNLGQLEVSTNPITSINITGLTQLWYLGCSSTPVTSLDLTTNINLGGLDANYCTNLLSLDASGTLGPSMNLYGTTNIQHLNLHGCQIDGQTLQTYLQHMGSLITLDLAGIQGITYLSFGGTSLDITGCTSIQQLFVGGPSVNSININSFVNLTDLELRNGNLTSLDLTPLTNLRYVNCSNNQLTNLVLPSQNNLTQVWCTDNQLTNINISGVPMLELLFCSNNLLTNLDLTSTNNLNVLSCRNNQIPSINVNNLIQLSDLSCGNNPIITLDVSNNLLLRGLSINNTQIGAINLSNNPILDRFSFENTPIQSMDLSSFTNLYYTSFGSDSLINLNLKNGKNETITFTNSPNLAFICADESQIANLQAIVNTNTVTSSYCSFVPGGDYNTVSGIIKLDQDNNGCDSGDFVSSYIKVTLNGGTDSGSTFTNTNGNYSLYTQTGNFNITPVAENPSYFNFSPVNAIIDFPLLNNSIQTQNFCASANGFHPDLEIIIAPILRARPGFDANYKIVYKNKGNQILNGIVNLIFDDARTDFVSALPAVDNQQSGTLTWNFSNLNPFETRAIDLVLNLNTPLENPPLNSGDVLHFTANSSSSLGEGTPLDNTFELNQNVVNSMDPNDKTCLEGNVITPDDIGKYVHYNINFENVGTANAVNVVIKDLIDTTQFDVNSLQLLYASHPVETKIDGNKVEFVFENINLPPSNINPIGGHGNVLFKLKTLTSLLVGDQIANIANIYFDYNAPITTNEARSTFAAMNNSNFVQDRSITVAPNPAKNNVTVTSTGNIKSIELFDVQGRILQTILEDKNTATIDISNKSNGIYFLKVTTEIGSSIQKLVKE